MWLLDGIQYGDRPEVVGVLVFFVLAGWIAMSRVGRPMSRRAGQGNVAFELAGSSNEAKRLLRAWGEEGCTAARRSIAIDFPWIAAYVGAIALSSLYLSDAAARAGREVFRELGVLAAWGVVAAGVLDVAENIGMLASLRNPTSSRVRFVFLCATAKFALVAVALAYCAAARGSLWLFAGSN